MASEIGIIKKNITVHSTSCAPDNLLQINLNILEEKIHQLTTVRQLARKHIVPVKFKITKQGNK